MVGHDAAVPWGADGENARKPELHATVTSCSKTRVVFSSGPVPSRSTWGAHVTLEHC